MRRYEAPYSHDNAASKRRKMARPKDLLAWFLQGFREEMPDRLHTRGVWRDAKRRGDAEAYDPVGGSALGSPRMADPFRAFIEDDPFGTEAAEYEGHKDVRNHYRTPMRAALARLAGRGETEPCYFMARALFGTAYNDGDWEAACRHMVAYKRADGATVVDEAGSQALRRTFIEAALHRLYERFHEEPPVYTTREDAA